MAASKQRESAPDADVDDEHVESGTSLPTATAIDKKAPAARPDPFLVARRATFLGALVVGWFFILYINRFNFSAPTVFVCLAYLALVSTGYALWRTGIVVVAEDNDDGDSTWGRPLGRRSELEREKKTLLKAIKEAEFDREMGKLSKVDAEEMIAVYRVRAIEVIKEIDQLDAGTAGSVREQIERELKARLEISTKADKAKADAIADANKDKKKKAAASKKAPDKKADEKTEEKTEEKVDDKVEAPKAETVAKADEPDAPKDDAKEATS